MSQTQIRVNFPTDCESMINKIINLQLYTCHNLTSMSCYCDRDDITLKGFGKFFKDLATMCVCAAKKMMFYQNMRGGRVVFQDVKKPEKDEWGTPMEMMTTCMTMMKNMTQALTDIHKVATTGCDTVTCRFITVDFMCCMTEIMKFIGEHMTCLKKCGTEHMKCDKMMMEKCTMMCPVTMMMQHSTFPECTMKMAEMMLPMPWMTTMDCEDPTMMMTTTGMDGRRCSCGCDRCCKCCRCCHH